MKFRAHDTFFIRKGWLSKGMKAVHSKPDVFVAKDENPMDVLGIGSNMVKSLRYWLVATNLTEEALLNKRRVQKFTGFGNQIFKNDRYMEEYGTLYLLHYMLSKNEEDATAWYFFFNEFNMSEFTREDFVAALQNYVSMKGETVAMIDDNPDLAWVFPEEGSVLSVDCMAVPAASEHKEAAEMFINFMCETDIGKANSEYIGYTTPMHDVWEVLDEDLKTSEIAYPSEEDAAREKVFTALSDEVNSELDLKWSEMKSYDEGGGSYLFLLLLLAMLALACFNIWRKVRRKTRNQY